MKSHYTVEQFFYERFRGQLGVVLALLRGAFGYALVNTALSLHTFMPEALVRLKAQVVPFLEVLATAWSFSSWRVVVIVAGIAFGAGIFTRTAAALFLLFFAGTALIDWTTFVTSMGSWTGVSILLLMMALCSSWGRVFGLEELVERTGFFAKKRTRGGSFF